MIRYRAVCVVTREVIECAEPVVSSTYMMGVYLLLAIARSLIYIKNSIVLELSLEGLLQLLFLRLIGCC